MTVRNYRYFKMCILWVLKYIFIYILRYLIHLEISTEIFMEN